jgi:hypothetical protein
MVPVWCLEALRSAVLRKSTAHSPVMSTIVDLECHQLKVVHLMKRLGVTREAVEALAEQKLAQRDKSTRNLKSTAFRKEMVTEEKMGSEY